ncbi:MAG: ArsR family transcriptional regulator [Gaiellales bacterium]|nr:MAG: ArsR family transcriptional regulator [Gaiellales bacterium]
MLTEYESVMKAAGDPTRARILKLLEAGELCVCDMIEVLGLGQSTVSGHLAVLREAGLVKDRKEGRWAYYSLAERVKGRYASPLLALLFNWLDDDARVRADRRRLNSLRASRDRKGCD